MSRYFHDRLPCGIKIFHHHKNALPQQWEHHMSDRKHLMKFQPMHQTPKQKLWGSMDFSSGFSQSWYAALAAASVLEEACGEHTMQIW